MQVAVGQPRAQPCPEVIISEHARTPPGNPGFLVFSIVLMIVCGLHLCLPAFVCLIPGLLFALKVQLEHRLLVKLVFLTSFVRVGSLSA